MATRTISCLLLSNLFLISCFLNPVAALDNREALEIVIGGGGWYAPPPEDCPPPPPPPIPICPSPEPPISPPPPSPLPPVISSPPPPKPQSPLPPSPRPRPPSSPMPAPLIFESAKLEMAYKVIMRLKARIVSDPKMVKKTWEGADICNKYRGFTCYREMKTNQKTIAAVDFDDFNFAGRRNRLPISDFIDQLPDLAVFHINSNNFSDEIPKSISKLPYLFELDLSNNIFSGRFPTEVLGATNLLFLDLRFNFFSDTVLPQVFFLPVDVLFLNNNNFNQALPDTIGSTPAVYLTLANNKFVGSIPKTIGNTSKTLQEVLFLNNKLSGCLPYEIGFLRNTTVFDVSANELTGPIPHSFACLAKMERLVLAVNKFYGPVPEQLCMLPNMRNLSLSHNYFTQVGPECRKLIKKKMLDVRMNCILDLPVQKSAKECAEFFSKPHGCPNERELTIIPCDKKELGIGVGEAVDDWQSEVSAPPPNSYNVLVPH